MEWSALTGNLGLTAWIVLCVALCGLLSFSFVKNLRTISEISADFQKMPVLRGEIAADLTASDQLPAGDREVEEQNRNWWIPRFGLRESLHVEKGLKERYCRQFREAYLQPLDRRLTDTLRALPPSVADEPYALVHDPPHPADQPAPGLPGPQRAGGHAQEAPAGLTLLMGRDSQAADPEWQTGSTGTSTVYYLAWRTDPDEMRREIGALQAHDGPALRRARLGFAVADVARGAARERSPR